MTTFLRSGLFFSTIVALLALVSCKKTVNDVIPNVYIDFTIDLLDPEFVALSAIGVSDTINSSTNNWGYKSAGFDDNGIIVYSGPDEYFAYDRTCPYDFVVNDKSIKVNIDYAVALCPLCGTEYALSSFGMPIKGPGKYQLKNYKTSFDGERYIRVWNQ
jgi:nitrite reductase/ring-hydroxylating ferredoxin subunit